MKKPVEIAIIAALKAAGPQHHLHEESRRKTAGVAAAREALGKVSKLMQVEIEAALVSAWCVAQQREHGHSSHTRIPAHQQRRGVSHTYSIPERGMPTLRERVAQAQRMLCDAHMLRSGDTLVTTRQITGRTLASLLTEAREFLAAKAAARATFKAKRTSEIARVRGVLSTLSPVVLDAWQHCGYRSASERWCDRAGESVQVGIVDGAAFELLLLAHPDSAQLVATFPGVQSTSEKVWDSGGKMRSGTATTHRLYVRETWVEDVAHRTLAVVDSLLTLDAQRVVLETVSPFTASYARQVDNADVYAAVWVEQSRGLEVKAVSGFIAAAQTGNGLVAVHGSTACGALRTLEKRIHPEKSALRREELDAKKSRKTAVEQQRDAAFKAFCNEMHFSFDLHVLANLLPVCYAIAAGALDAEITLSDSTPKTSGNCVSGTRDWVARHMPGRTKATVGEVAQAALQSGDRADLAWRACRFAVLRWAGSQSRANRKAA